MVPADGVACDVPAPQQVIYEGIESLGRVLRALEPISIFRANNEKATDPVLFLLYGSQGDRLVASTAPHLQLHAMAALTAGSLPDCPDSVKSTSVLGTGETIDEMIAMLPDDKVRQAILATLHHAPRTTRHTAHAASPHTKVTFCVIKTSANPTAKSSFDRKGVCFVVYKGTNISAVKSAKFMARKLQVEVFVGKCTKTVASAVCDDKETAADEILAELRKCLVDDSHDIGDSSFKVSYST
jgi:hypothetical protein